MPDQARFPSFASDPARDRAARRRALLACAAALWLPALPACAFDARSAWPPVALSVVDRATGEALAVYRKDGRAYVAGSPGARYAIRLSNRSGGRVLVVLSVDGVNVISGQTAAYGQTGYVLDPWRSYEIAGWRKSDTEVAAFEFAALRDSYAARTGRPANVGVIGAAVFLERPAPVAVAPLPGPPQRADSTGASEGRLNGGADAGRALNGSAKAAAAPAAQSAVGATIASRAAEVDEHLGTAHGEREWSVSTRTEFERLSSRPQAVVEIAYDSLPNLVAAGVVPSPVARAQPFPGADARGFVPDPPPR